VKNPHDENVRFEFPDPTPVVLDVGDERTPNTLDGLMEQARHRAALAEANLYNESFEEADDFDVPDDIPDYGNTRWEIEADASTLTADELFVRLYGITRDEAISRLNALNPVKQDLTAPKSGSDAALPHVAKPKPPQLEEFD